MKPNESNRIDEAPVAGSFADENLSETTNFNVLWYKSIRVKIMLLAGIPLLFALVLSLHLILDSANSYSQTARLQTFVQLSTHASSYMHESQFERGLTNVYLGTQGEHFTNKLGVQRRITDQARAEFTSYLADVDAHQSSDEVHELIIELARSLEDIDRHRVLVDRHELSASEASEFYTDHNNIILNAIRKLPQLDEDHHYSRKSMALSSFLLGKEHAAIERYIEGSAFAVDLLSTNSQMELGSHILAQESHFSAYLQLATNEQIEDYIKMTSAPVFIEVENFRSQIFQEQRIKPSDLLWAARLDTIQVQQWLTDISVTRAQDGLNDGFDLAQEFATDFHQQLDTLLTLTSDATEDIHDLRVSFDSFHAMGISMANQYIQHGTQAGNIAMKEFDRHAQDIDDKLTQLSSEMVHRSGFAVDPDQFFQTMTQKINLMRDHELVISRDLVHYLSEMQAISKKAFILRALTTTLICLLAIVAVLHLGAKISKPIAELSQISEAIAHGNLGGEIIVKNHDEIGKLSSSFNKMTASLASSFAQNIEQTATLNKAVIDSQNHRTAIDEHSFVSMTDIRGNITYVNDKFVQISGYSREELIGQNHRIINSDEHDKEFFRDMWKTIASKNIWNGDVKNRAKDGSYYWVNATIIPFKNADGQITDYFAIRTDISEAKFAKEQAESTNITLKAQSEELLTHQDSLHELNASMQEITRQAEESKTAAQAADKSKSEFLANMSHEIRTPMTAILGFAETVADNVTSPENVEAISIIRRNGEHLLNIINDILDISKLDAGKMTIESIATSPVELVEDIVTLVKIRTQAKGLTLDTTYEGEIPETVQTDPTRLRQILVNILGNAIKFTEQGGITLKVSFINDGDESEMYFDTIDTGIGMSEEQVSCLFQPFVQADNSTTRKFGGTGLGLTISKRFANLLGGDLTIPTSTPGAGTTFRATIATGPIDGIKMITSTNTQSTRPVQKTKKQTHADLTGYRILLAEDGPDNQKLISFVLSKAGAQVQIAENGKIALDEALIAHKQGNDFDCILMDMQMPVMSGYEATQALRLADYTGLIIALTAHAMKDDRDKCIQAGCDDFANKPINRAELINLVYERSQRRSKAA